MNKRCHREVPDAAWKLEQHRRRRKASTVYVCYPLNPPTFSAPLILHPLPRHFLLFRGVSMLHRQMLCPFDGRVCIYVCVCVCDGASASQP